MYEAKTDGKKKIILKVTNGLSNKKVMEDLKEFIPLDHKVNAYYYSGVRGITQCELSNVLKCDCEVISPYIPPELVLGNELGITCCSIVSVLKDYFKPDFNRKEALDASRDALEPILTSFLEKKSNYEFNNVICSQYPFSSTL